MKFAIHILVLLLMITYHFVNTGVNLWSRIILFIVVIIMLNISFVNFWNRRELLRIGIQDILILMYFAFLFLNSLINSSFNGNERLHDYLIAFVLYFAFILLFDIDKALLTFLLYGVMCGLVIELTVGFGQLFGLISNADDKFILGGLFGNPGAFAGYLAVNFSLLLAILLLQKQLNIQENLLYVIILCFCGVLCLLLLCDSRGAWLASAAGASFVIFPKLKHYFYIKSFLRTRFLKFLAWVVLLSVICGSLISLYQYKEDSAYGRMVIWKISKTMVQENPLFGNGYGSFASNYSNIQAKYFMSGNGSASEIQVADYVTCPYNEYLEILIESGIIGLLLFLGIIYSSFVTKYDDTTQNYRIIARASLVSLLFLGLVSYPFRLHQNLLILIICLFIVSRTGQYGKIVIGKYLNLIVITLYISFSWLVYESYRLISGNYHFQAGYMSVLNNNLEDGISEYIKANLTLNQNGEFLFYYGAALNLRHDYSGSIVLLQKAVRLRGDPNAYIMLGNSLQQLKRYTEAENAYQMAAGITPSKLYPKYLLSKLYIEMQQIGKALIMADIIINAKEKVSSSAGSEIKDEMKALIRQYTQSNVKPLKSNNMGP